jgi:CubicO group peptidase (beta-lactamase class C family)
VTTTHVGKRRAPWILGFTFSCAAAFAQTSTPKVDPRAEAARACALEEFGKQKLVALSLAIAENGKVVYTQHLGFEDREKSIPATDATLYRWASISKPLTAVIAMQLSNEKKLDLDADVRRYVPEFPEKAWPITARQLLCHQGGVVHYSNGLVIPSPPRKDVEHPYFDAVDALAKFALSPLLHEPGTKYEYTTHGYVLLGAVEQRAAGELFPKLVNERVVRPLGMKTLQPDYAWVAIPHRAAGYQENGKKEIVLSDDVDVSWKLPGGGFISNVVDLALFSTGLLEDKLVDHATREKMWTRQRTKDGAETSYGLGFQIGERDGRREVHHGGAQEKTRTFLLMLPERHLGIALMTNCEWGKLPALGRAIADAWKSDAR